MAGPDDWAALYVSDYYLTIACARMYQRGARDGRTGVQGRIEYSRRTLLRLSATEFLAFSGIFAICALLTGSAFVLGSAVGCLSIAVKHWRLARAVLERVTEIR